MMKKRFAVGCLAALVLVGTVTGLPMGAQVQSVYADYVDFSDYPVIKELYADDFRVGVACEAISHWNNRKSEIGNPDKEALMLQEFNTMTFGNELKPDYNMDYKSPEATETNLPFGANPAAIEMLEWARYNGMPVRGHTLIWHSQCPDAVFCKGYQPVYQKDKTLDPACLVDAETMKQRMESYIYHVMEYMYANGYADVIYAWDVVNEAIEPGANKNNMRESYWYQTIGPEFLYDAFRYTREAVEKYSVEYAKHYRIDASDQEALKAIQPKLFYNDYNEFQVSKRDAILKAVEPMVADGYIDGIGMQGHISDTTNIESFITAMQMYSDAVGEVQVTELDVAQSSSGPAAEYNQGIFYYDLFQAMLEARASGVNLTSVTIWGLTDDNSWKRETSPLIFNGDLSKKTAFDGIVCAKTGEAMPEPEFDALDFSDETYSFEEEGVSPEALGFTKRGDVTAVIQGEETCEGSGALYISGRMAGWNGVSFDVSRFIGQKIQIDAWVKSEDAKVVLATKNNGTYQKIASADTAGEDWVLLSGVYTVPVNGVSFSLNLETTGRADLYVDEICVRLADPVEDMENGLNFTTRWGGAGTLAIVPDGENNHAARLSDKSESYYGISYDVSLYLGSQVEISFDVKTEDTVVKLTGDIDGEWPNYITADVTPGEYTRVSGIVDLPAGLAALRVYIETNGLSDIYLDNFCIKRVS